LSSKSGLIKIYQSLRHLATERPLQNPESLAVTTLFKKKVNQSGVRPELERKSCYGVYA